MNYKYLIVLFLSAFIATSGVSQDDTTDVDATDKIQGPEPLEIVFKPQLSLGTGMFTFYGDIGSNHKGYHPTVSRIGYDLRLTNPLTDYLDMGFYVLFGQVSGSERTLTRNLNFNSHITTGGMTINYNFKQLLNPKRKVDPYVSVGIESMEFLSKTDMYDANGNKYNYWSDGTIRDMEEGSVGSENATEIFRDYVYESDIRELDLDGFGKYSERTWAIPVEIGANFHLSKRVKFRVGTSMHFALTDLVDGVTSESLGDRQGNKGNDKFLYSHFALSYDLSWGKSKYSGEGPELPDWDLYRQDTIDSDGDMVVDLADLCAKTPLNARPVDEFGCPLDNDYDLVEDYKDDELNTEKDAFVNDKGVTLTDEDFELAYRMYKDSIGEFAYMADCTHITIGEGPRYVVSNGKNEGFVDHAVVFESDNGQLPKDVRDRLLDQPGFHVIQSADGSHEYVVREYKTLEEATAAMDQFKKDGMDVKGIAKVSKDESMEFVPQSEIDKAREALAANGGNNEDMNKGTTFRVQIGAFRKELSTSVFSDADDVVYVEGDDGLFRYYSGASKNKNDAAKHRVRMLEKGYDGAFIVAFKDGKRITLGQAELEVSEGFNDVIIEETEPTGSVVRRELIRFKVQVGAYSGDVPTEVLDLYLAIGNIKFKRDADTGLIKYFLGEFESYDEAEEYKFELEREGLIDSFVIGDFNGKIITAQEALELLND